MKASGLTSSSSREQAIIDAYVLALLWEVPEPHETLAARAGLTLEELRASMNRIALRDPLTSDLDARSMPWRKRLRDEWRQVHS